MFKQDYANTCHLSQQGNTQCKRQTQTTCDRQTDRWYLGDHYVLALLCKRNNWYYTQTPKMQNNTHLFHYHKSNEMTDQFSEYWHICRCGVKDVFFTNKSTKNMILSLFWALISKLLEIFQILLHWYPLTNNPAN